MEPRVSCMLGKRSITRLHSVLRILSLFSCIQGVEVPDSGSVVTGLHILSSSMNFLDLPQASVMKTQVRSFRWAPESSFGRVLWNSAPGGTGAMLVCADKC